MKKQLKMSEENEGLESSKMFIQPKSHSVHLYLGEIGPPSEYYEFFQTVSLLDEDDEIIIHINSPGGYLSTALQFMRILSDTNADTIAQVEGECMSAATMVFLACSEWKTTKYSTFMFHNYSGGAVGKGHELFDKIAFDHTNLSALVTDIYEDFLTPDEINKILDGKDIYMDGEEVSNRLEIRIKAFLKKLDDEEKKEEEAAKAEAKPKRVKKAKVVEPVVENETEAN
jgi:ATP-dependent protease ClpP protease subunit